MLSVLGTETMRIEGVDKLHAVEHSIVQDRIEAVYVHGSCSND